MLATIRAHAAELSPASRRTLAELGLEMARLSADEGDDRWERTEVCAAVEEVEAALGVVGVEACRDLLGTPTPPEDSPSVEADPAFDMDSMKGILDGKYAATRASVRAVLRQPLFRHEIGLDTATYRERVAEWVAELARHGFGKVAYPKAVGGEGDLGKMVAIFDTLAFCDLSLVIKYGVHFGLFGCSVLFLGTEHHHQTYLPRIGSFELPGCFAMTELGHGSNVRDLETTATYDPGSCEWVIRTPTESARKEFIGNAAQHGQMATVFAQLETQGESHGVHAFLVPIRSADGGSVKGVRIADCGEKVGLNGVDNGRIWFDAVRIPRENLLDRFGSVDESGNYSSPISSASKRFFTMLGTLVGGRISIAAAALSAAKSGLTIAIRYGAKRRQFGPVGAPETRILDYPTHQRRLMPCLATAYGLNFAIEHLVSRYTRRTEEDEREVEVLAAGLKAFSTWNTMETLQICRECCGGQGYLAENQLGRLREDTDVFTTFEGDNTVLMQLVSKGLLTDFKKQFAEMKLFGIAKYVMGKAATAITEMNPFVTRFTAPEHLTDTDFQLSAFRYREEDLLTSVAKRLRKRLEADMDSFQAFIECQSHLIDLAEAYAERVILEQFARRVSETSDVGIATALKTLCDLYALSRMERARGWFLENDYIESGKAKAIRRQVNTLCGQVRVQAVHLVDAFGIPLECLSAPIASPG
jgi:acyl-CoA oxidase